MILTVVAVYLCIGLLFSLSLWLWEAMGMGKLSWKVGFAPAVIVVWPLVLFLMLMLVLESDVDDKS